MILHTSSQLFFCFTCVLTLAAAPAEAGDLTPVSENPDRSEIERVIRESDYHVTWQEQTTLPDLDAAWHAANREQNLKFYFTGEGLMVVDHSAAGSPELLQLAVSERVESDANPKSFDSAGNRLTISCRGSSESFANSRRGLEHILTIYGDANERDPLVIDLKWSAAAVSVEDHAVEFRATGGRRLIYSSDLAVDAVGTPLEVEFSISGDRIQVAVHGPDPIFPITVKNLLTGTANTVLEGNLQGLGFGLVEVGARGDFNGDGYSDVAALALDWAGSHGHDGAVMIFHGGPGGIASNGSGPIGSAADAIIESDLDLGSWPHRIASIGDVNGDGRDDLVAASSFWDPTGPPGASRNRGGIWIFHGSAAGITAAKASEADAVVVSNVDDSHFGESVRGAGDINGDGYADLMVCASSWSDSGSEVSEGAVFVFHGSGTGIVASSIDDADTILEGNQYFLRTGLHLAGIGDVNGDGFDDVAIFLSLSNPEVYEGAVAVFYGSATGIAGNPTQSITTHADALIEGNEPGMAFGEAIARSVDVNGDGFSDLVIGSAGWSDQSLLPSEGVLLIFHGGASGIASNPVTPAVDIADTVIEGNPVPPATGLQFGLKVASGGDVDGDGYGDIVATANLFSHPEGLEGGAFVFLGRDGGIPSSRVLPVEDVADRVIEINIANLYFGQARPDAGDVNGDGFSDLVFGAGLYDNGQPAEGAVFIYHGGADLPETEADVSGVGAHSDFYLGRSVATAGDVNGDGFVDLAVGAPSSVGVGSNPPGMVFVFHGSPDPDLSPDWSAEGDNTYENYGRAVSSAGDVNGDGFGDLVVGVPLYTNGEIDEGRAEVFLGSASGLAFEPDWTFESNVAGALFGYAVASAGDVDGDGYGDVIVGAPNYGDGQTDEGRVYVFFGSSNGLEEIPGWTFESDLADAWLGAGVGGAGDVNGDGFADIVVGAPYFESGETDEGAAYVFSGAAGGLPSVPNWFIQTNRAGALYGIAVAGAGDVNADGYSDVIVGATWDSNPEYHEGRAYIYHGSFAGLSTTADVVLETNRADGGFGLSVDPAGDLNGDGYSDVIVGANTDSGALGGEGRAYVFLGSEAGVAGQAAWFAEGNNQYDEFGTSVAGLGDHDGDGFSDLAIGAPFADGAAVRGGLVELYRGNGGAGRPVFARQVRGAGDPTPVQPWGLTHSGDDFQVSLTATSPHGRELVKLNVEACPAGKTWGETECRHQVSMNWTPIPVGENSVVLTETLAGLTEGELYHWRAHVLYAPLHADEPGITDPPVPRHGPWRTLSARAAAADIRVGHPQTITIEFVSTAGPVGEAVPQAQVDVVMTTSNGAASAIDSSVEFNTFDGTAVAGEDYVHTSLSRFFPAGTADGTVQTIDVNLLDDTLDEPDEEFVVELVNPFGAILGSQAIHTVAIIDDDAPPELSTASIQVDEHGGPAVVTLELSAPTAFEVAVNFQTIDGSATAPFDYEHVSGTALILPLGTQTTVEIPIVDDWLEEDEESFTLELSAPVNAVLTTATVEVDILDNDAGILFADGFEAGTTGAWSATTP